ncbi:MAG: glycerol-3-phosphate acyltransferase [Desulfobacteraceae bacterium]|nr:glycerol-3-phosphate acyltransferase [Desulfobacteraceae bacterium]
MLLANYFFDLSTISLGLIGAGAIIGHGYPLFFNFKGGRAAGTLMGIYLFFIPYELLVSFIIIPFIVFNLTTDVKIIIWATGFIGLFFNRTYLPIRVKTLLQKDVN